MQLTKILSIILLSSVSCLGMERKFLELDLPGTSNSHHVTVSNMAEVKEIVAFGVHKSKDIFDLIKPNYLKSLHEKADLSPFENSIIQATFSISKQWEGIKQIIDKLPSDIFELLFNKGELIEEGTREEIVKVLKLLEIYKVKIEKACDMEPEAVSALEQSILLDNLSITECMNFYLQSLKFSNVFADFAQQLLVFSKPYDYSNPGSQILALNEDYCTMKLPGSCPQNADDFISLLENAVNTINTMDQEQVTGFTRNILTIPGYKERVTGELLRLDVNSIGNPPQILKKDVSKEGSRKKKSRAIRRAAIYEAKAREKEGQVTTQKSSSQVSVNTPTTHKSESTVSQPVDDFSFVPNHDTLSEKAIAQREAKEKLKRLAHKEEVKSQKKEKILNLDHFQRVVHNFKAQLIPSTIPAPIAPTYNIDTQNYLDDLEKNRLSKVSKASLFSVCKELGVKLNQNAHMVKLSYGLESYTLHVSQLEDERPDIIASLRRFFRYAGFIN